VKKIVYLIACSAIICISFPEGTRAQRTGAFLAPEAREAGPPPKPFASNNGQIPPNWKGHLFELSHAYPTVVPPVQGDPPWQVAIGKGRITVDNAAAYVAALKEAIAPDMKIMLLNNAAWNAAKRGWYNEPWLGSLRESLHGMYVGSADFPKALFDGSGLTKDFSTYVLTYYDDRAANSLFRVWGRTAMKPVLSPGPQQFDENGVIVKAAFTTANADVWPVMQGALQWPLYITTNATTGDHQTPQVDQASFMQFDLIVKDSKSAPKTAWVFATLVYDANAPGNDVWEKMVPLGAMWGNDPESNSAQPSPPPLRENWINPAAPAYAKMTLGWGGRLSGPNDGALNDAIIGSKTGKKASNLPSSSCMSCHGPSEWPMKSFLLPTTTMPPQVVDNDYLVMWPPGSPEWMRWFQSRPGTQPQDPGTVAFDYDMVYVFKSLPAWQKATTGRSALMSLQRNGIMAPGGNYNGRPFSAR
jgi:hypothetical protein